MILYKDYETFVILGQEVNVITDETPSGFNTVAEINDRYYYLGDEPPGVLAAIFAWQDMSGRELTNKELDQALVDNT